MPSAADTAQLFGIHRAGSLLPRFAEGWRGPLARAARPNPQGSLRTWQREYTPERSHGRDFQYRIRAKAIQATDSRRNPLRWVELASTARPTPGNARALSNLAPAQLV